MRPPSTLRNLGVAAALAWSAVAAPALPAAVFHHTCCPGPVGAFFGYYPTEWRVGLPMPPAHVAAEGLPVSAPPAVTQPGPQQPAQPSAPGDRPEPSRSRGGPR